MDVDPGTIASQNHQRCLMLGRQEANKKELMFIDLGCVVMKRKVQCWTCRHLILVVFILFGPPVIMAESAAQNKPDPPPADKYAEALHKALLFFNAQKSGRLPKNNGIPWRGDSGLSDGSATKRGLVGGYYDGGSNIKFHFPMAFSMTLLSWSVIEYSAKYKAVGEYEHVRELIKWGTDYLLLTFNSSASTIDGVDSQVGVAMINGSTPDDRYCWNRPEDMTYQRPTIQVTSAPDLGGEIAASLAAASVVFRDNNSIYSKKLVQGAVTMYKFARKMSSRFLYSRGNPSVEPYYNSTGYWDEHMWSAAWLFYATGNTGYIRFATDPRLRKNAIRPFNDALHDGSVFSWDNKVPGASLLLSRLPMFLNYTDHPDEQSFTDYQNDTGANMCRYFPRFAAFSFTKGGLALFKINQDKGQPLQYAVANSFLATLYADYMDAVNVPGLYCGPIFMSTKDLRGFAKSQLNYILGDNPRKMSYVVGIGKKYPRHLQHRAASTPHDSVKYSCTGGFRWRDSSKADPNMLTGAMVGGPDMNDGFNDTRNSIGHSEPTLAGNAGLVAALVAITDSGRGVSDSAVDKNTMFSSVPPKFP